MKTIQVIIIVALMTLMGSALTAFAAHETPEGMVLVKGGCFNMGTDTGYDDSQPVHKVCVGDFFLDTHEVTQEDYEAVMDTNPSNYIDPIHPVEKVTWYEANEYCESQGKRLPTEAEWEFAARERGKKMEFPGFDSEKKIDDFCWNSYVEDDKQTSPVGHKKPNELGLYDMCGNVTEWTADWYSATYYETSPRQDPLGPVNGKYKVARGGSWCDRGLDYFQAATRLYRVPEQRGFEYGFRCAKSP